MPSLATSFGPSTSQLMRGNLASPRATSPRCAGVAWLAGRLAHSRASVTPSAMLVAWRKAVRTASASGTPICAACRCLSSLRLSLRPLVAVYT